jgi:hypothetical protein
MAWINEAMQGEASTPARSPKVVTHGIRARRPTELDPLLVALQSYAYHNCLVSCALDCHQLLLVPHLLHQDARRVSPLVHHTIPR